MEWVTEHSKGTTTIWCVWTWGDFIPKLWSLNGENNDSPVDLGIPYVQTKFTSAQETRSKMTRLWFCRLAHLHPMACWRAPAKGPWRLARLARLRVPNVWGLWSPQRVDHWVYRIKCEQSRVHGYLPLLWNRICWYLYIYIYMCCPLRVLNDFDIFWQQLLGTTTPQVPQKPRHWPRVPNLSIRTKDLTEAPCQRQKIWSRGRGPREEKIWYDSVYINTI